MYVFMRTFSSGIWRDRSMAVDAIKSGALDFIEKPFRGSEIVARLDEAIGSYARRRAEDS